MESIFKDETGKHIVQRYPKNDKHGKKHTSFVCVAVLPLLQEYKLTSIPEHEISVETLSGIGPGGQHMQKTDSVVRMRHIPTGIQATCGSRSQSVNRKIAMKILCSKVSELYIERERNKYRQDKRTQIKLGRGGEKTRTYNFSESRVTDHRTGIKTRNIKAVMKGDLGILKRVC